MTQEGNEPKKSAAILNFRSVIPSLRFEAGSLYCLCMKYNFDQSIERRGTDSVKWSVYSREIIPLWVADMDFRSADPIVWALRSRADHSVFGYNHKPKRLVQAEQAGPPLWTSNFHISHRINATLSMGSIYFAGDAAHVHSPMGARGMNLGLEDAFVFAELVRTGRLDEYDRLRRPIDGEVVRRVEYLSQIVSAESWFNWLVRSFVLPRAVKIPFVRSRMVGTVTGLDHKLPLGLAGGTS